VFDENAAAALCYTSGTTGNPKGVLYSHRSTLLHSFFLLAGGGETRLTQRDVILPVVPLFHVNAWGLPYAAPMTGASLVFPGPKLDGESLFELMEETGVTAAWGVPTVWLGLLEEMAKRGRRPRALELVVVGGAAAPKPLIARFEGDFGVQVTHGWGMTEMSPVGTLGTLPPSADGLPFDGMVERKAKQGRFLFGVEHKIVDETGQRLPHDGVAFGELLVRGASITSGYYKNAEASEKAFDDEGFFRTGDVATIDAEGTLNIVDRAKDVIKSGGEWISSIDLENAAVGHPAIAEAAVIAIPHPKWTERPLLIAVRRDGHNVSADELKDYLSDKVAKWWLPEAVVFVDELPHTATGKLQKTALRERFGDLELPEE
jgi:fatty-acyl-CoA synthase